MPNLCVIPCSVRVWSTSMMYGFQPCRAPQRCSRGLGASITITLSKLTRRKSRSWDGSAVSVCIPAALYAGIDQLNCAKKFVRIKETVRVEDGDKRAEFKPYNGLSLDFTIDFMPSGYSFQQPALCDQLLRLMRLCARSAVRVRSVSCVISNICSIPRLRALGGSLHCAIVVDRLSRTER
ncbi:UDP-3-O-acyl-N-acetylglucosamine deacetylase [Escherichia coli]